MVSEEITEMNFNYQHSTIKLRDYSRSDHREFGHKYGLLPRPSPLDGASMHNTQFYNSTSQYHGTNRSINGTTRTTIIFINKLELLLMLTYVILTLPVAFGEIADCVSLDSLRDLSDSYNGTFCFCKSIDDQQTAIRCLYGSTLEHLQKALQAVTDAQRSVHSVFLKQMHFEDGNLSMSVFQILNGSLTTLIIDECMGLNPLNLLQEFGGVEENLENFSITDCNLEKLPDAISRMHNLLTLNLTNNKLISIERKDLQNLKKLKSLDLSMNFISDIENGSFSTFARTLSTLRIGVHNFINLIIFRQIAELENLQVLDMDQADGVSRIPENTFQKLNRLEQLLLSGCSLTMIDANTFDGLHSLTELDLRINLITEIECDSFKVTPNLRRLSLAGNFLNHSNRCMWRGLRRLTHLDIGWNDFVNLENRTFAELEQTLKKLDLRHNVQLSQIEPDTFNGLKNLNTLNLTDTSITSIHLQLTQLQSLKELDLSNSQMNQIEIGGRSELLQKLLLRGNKLESIPSQLLYSLPNITEIDFSLNPWHCNQSMLAMVTAIDQWYTIAGINGIDFALLNANRTICANPSSLRDRVITDIEPEDFNRTELNEITASTTTDSKTLSPEAVWEELNGTEIERVLKGGTLIGTEQSQDDSFVQDDAPKRPLYEIDIRSEEINEKTSDNNSLPIIAAICAFTAVTVAVISAIVSHMKKLKQRRADRFQTIELKNSDKDRRNGFSQVNCSTIQETYVL